MDQREAPLFHALLTHANRYNSDFHVPGHKQGQLFDEDGQPFFQKLLALDLTEVGHLDDLHEPTGVIKQAEQLAAQAFGATRTWFLVGGSTVGNLALIKAVCEPGDDIIIQRNSHKSVFNGCILAGVRPIYIQPEFDETIGVYTGVTVEKLRTVLQRHPNTKAVFLTNPNYYGMYQPIAELADVCKYYGIPLLVDEAHGAHFSVHPDLPQSAIQSGATAAVQSTHKMLPAMTMGAMVHVHGTAALREKIHTMLGMLQSSSPSYPLMASLDLARRYYATRAYNDVEKSLPVLNLLRNKLHSRADWKALSPGDPYKLILQRSRWNGYEIEAGLAAEGVVLELADSRNGLAVLPLSMGKSESDSLLAAVDGWSKKTSVPMSPPQKVPHVQLTDTRAQVPLSQLMVLRGEWSPLEQAAGRLAKRMVLPYPPGIPVVLPGEIYSRETIEHVRVLLQCGARFQGVTVTASNAYVEVVK